jgi:hypothetical protein
MGLESGMVLNNGAPDQALGYSAAWGNHRFKYAATGNPQGASNHVAI